MSIISSPPMMSMACKQAAVQPPLPPVALSFNMETYFSHGKVIFVIGATGTGKSRLAVDISQRFYPGEIVNSDKMQLYSSLEIATNKVTPDESRGVPHHLIGVIPDPDAPVSPHDFSRLAGASVDSILARGSLPIVAGGSNSFIEALVDNGSFRMGRELCFLWVDVAPDILQKFVSERVDKMVEAGLVEEVRDLFHLSADYSQGIRRAIGAPELHELFRAELRGAGPAERRRLLGSAVQAIKENTWRLAVKQVGKIRRLKAKWGRSDGFHRIDATAAFDMRRVCSREADVAWERHVAEPGMRIVDEFLYGERRLVSGNSSRRSHSSPVELPVAVVR